MLENVGKPMGEIMREEGYAENTADNPKQVTETKSWEMLLEEYLPDDLLARVAKEGLGATMIKTSYTEPDKVVPDMPTRKQYLDTALKMKNKLTEKTDITSKGEKILVMPSELITKYDISSDTKAGSK